jgi:lysophospholipase L1-like esterase
VIPERRRRPRRELLVVAAVVVALTALASGPTASASPVRATVPVASPPAPVRIMPLGSSSTVGVGGSAEAGFRGPLEALLDRRGIAYDMVGSQHSGPAWLRDRDHEGHGGWTMARMQPLVAGWVARQRPDLVLLQVGTNDLIAGASAQVTAQRLDTMLSTIGAMSHAYVIVVGVWAPLPGHPLARAQYARLAQAVVARHRAAGQHTTFLDTGRLLGPTDLFDGLHPNAAGYRKIARLWERAICAYLRPGESGSMPELPSMDAMASFRSPAPIGRGVPSSTAVRSLTARAGYVVH